ncbi:MAG: phenylacetate--CoA ligase, partial [Clostridia bacterium]
MSTTNFWQKDIETMSREELSVLQLKRLQALVKRCYENVPFYTKRFDEIGLKPEDIKQLSDITKIPYTTKEDIRDNYPFGLFAVPKKEVVRLHASSGTTGKPTVVGYTKNDIDLWSDLVARFCAAVGTTDEDTVQICFGYGLFTGALGLHYGLEKIGASVIPASSGNTKKQVMLLKDLEATVLVSTPSYALYIAEVAKEMGISKEDLN